MTVKAGYKGAIYIGTTKIAGGATWTYGGSVRAMQATDEFGDEIVTEIPGQITGGEVTITGHYLLDSDAGQQLLKTLFDSGDQITNLKLYTDYDSGIYLTPDNTSSPASYATVTNCDNVGDDKSGIGTFTATLKISGVLKQVGATTEVAVVTIGSIDASNGGAGAGNGTVTLLGELVCAGEETGVYPKVQFEYGETTSYGSTTDLQNMSQTPQMFDADLTDLTEDATYHYRAVAVLEDSSKKYGVDRTFDIPADA